MIWTNVKIVAFKLSDFPNHVDNFGFILGIQRKTFRDQDPVNIQAAELVGKLHDALESVGYRGHNLECYLVRIVFCMFADDTGIFEPRDIFLDFIETRTGKDGANLGPWLSQLFQVLNTQENERSVILDEDLARFPYVNGDLFNEPLDIPSFDGKMREALLDACRFDWSDISPAIFGALFQSVMDPAQRRAEGAHYTTEKNILKVIDSLFMDDLRAEFSKINARKDNRRIHELNQFQKRLGQMRFFDPACGCGNFLVIAYREIRLLENEVIREIHTTIGKKVQQVLDVKMVSLVDVDQFFGIEINEFPVRIAETAMWMMDHIMNNRLSLELGQTYTRIPLQKSSIILNTDALEIDWSEFLPPGDCTFVLGNPPFVGSKLQTEEQRTQVQQIANLSKTGGTLDYVAAWFIKAAEYIRNTKVRIGFVSTNSITQGEQIAQLWPILLNKYKLVIDFAHRTFAWGSDARGKAHVHVVIVGMCWQEYERKNKQLFSYPDVNGDPEESQHTMLTPYLMGASGLSNPNLTVSELRIPIDGRTKMIMGSKPIDDGNYIFKEKEYFAFLETEPEAECFLRPFVGSREFLQGGKRWILALHNATPSQLTRLPYVRKRIAAVRSYRESSKSSPTQILAATPTLFHLNVLPTAPFLVVPRVSSERREYIPIGWLEPPLIPSDATLVLQNATLCDFALLTSAMHMAWLRHVGGRLESRYRYSIGLVYNTFPFPQQTDLSKLGPLAQDVLNARSAYPDSTLANLYDPDLMPPKLRKTHLALDRAVDRLYKRTGFASERDRIEHLFMLYEKI